MKIAPLRAGHNKFGAIEEQFADIMGLPATTRIERRAIQQYTVLIVVMADD
jgi:hypothetical protein